MFTKKQKVYCILNRCNYLTIKQIQQKLLHLFGDHISYDIAKQYRKDFERNHVGMVLEFGKYKAFQNKSKDKSYSRITYEEPKGITFEIIKTFIKRWIWH